MLLEKGDKGEVLWYEKGDNGIQFSRHIIPAIDNSYDIGSLDNRSALFAEEIYAGAGSIYVGEVVAVSLGDDGAVELLA